jgi:hypothetical protein
MKVQNCFGIAVGVSVGFAVIGYLLMAGTPMPRPGLTQLLRQNNVQDLVQKGEVEDSLLARTSQVRIYARWSMEQLPQVLPSGHRRAVYIFSSDERYVDGFYYEWPQRRTPDIVELVDGTVLMLVGVFDGGPPPDVQYKLLHARASGVDQLREWNLPLVQSEAAGFIMNSVRLLRDDSGIIAVIGFEIGIGSGNDDAIDQRPRRVRWIDEITVQLSEAP